MKRPIVPCSKCNTASYVWAEPCKYGEAGRYTRYEAICEGCGTRAKGERFSGFDTEDEAFAEWNQQRRNEAQFGVAK